MLTPGKIRNLMNLADRDGRFKMLAIDQRGSLVRMISKAMNKDKSEVTYDEMLFMKKAIVVTLAPHASSVLIDPIYGYPNVVKYFPKGVGVLLAYEETGYTDEAGERLTHLLKDWTAEKIKRSGANAIKVLLYYRKDASPKVREHQESIVRQVGEEAKKYDIPFILEPVGYALPKDGFEQKTPEYAKIKPRIVKEIVEEFSKDEYGVDILKIEFPADLKYTREFYKEFGNGKDYVYDLSEVKDFVKEVNAAAKKPWVVLSAGVDIDEFVENVKLACEGGASGFLGGRAIWKESVNFMPNHDAVYDYLSTKGVENIERVKKAAESAKPFWDHPSIGGFQNLNVEGAGEDWYRNY